MVQKRKNGFSSLVELLPALSIGAEEDSEIPETDLTGEDESKVPVEDAAEAFSSGAMFVFGRFCLAISGSIDNLKNK